MTELTAIEFARRAFEQNVLNEHQLQKVWAAFGTQDVPLEKLRSYLLQKSMLTSYQDTLLERDAKVGYYFGDYRALYQIGSGSFAMVVRATHKETKQTVAVKVLRPRKRKIDQELREQFQREGKVGLSLRHRNIVPIYEVGSSRGIDYLVMEFLEGQTLRNFLKARQKIEVKEAVGLMSDAIAGLTYAFNQGVTHRDLSTSNIFITSSGCAKIVDFGLAAVDNGEDSMNPRTVDYVGLERATGVDRNDTRSDIFFMGCIFYQMLSGQPALSDDKDHFTRTSSARFTEIKPLSKIDPSIPKVVTRIVDRAMDINAQMRYQSPGQMLSDLKIAARRLDDPNLMNEEESLPQRTIMVVDSDSEMQDVLRERLKKNDYRVLVVSNPRIALTRFEDNPKVADCVLFSTSKLGEEALVCFNLLGQELSTREVPAVLLLEKTHHEWMDRCKIDDHRVVLPMPLKLKELRAVLAKLAPPIVQKAS